MPRNNKRKEPSQARSKDTVDAIYTAGVQVLREHGIAKLSIRAVAERAGVSVGTLYQYFQSKEALLTALVERERSGVRAVLAALHAETQGMELGERVTRWVDALVDSKLKDPVLEARIVEAMIAIEGASFQSADTEPFIELVASAIAEHDIGRGLDQSHIDELSYVLVHAVEGVLHGYIEGGGTRDLDRLKQQLVHMILGLIASASTQHG